MERNREVINPAISNDEVRASSRGKREFFQYGVVITFTSTNQVLTVPTNVEADSDFYWEMLTGTNTDTTSPQVNGGSLLQFRDSGSGRLLSKIAIPFSDTVGTAQRPYVLPNPYTFQRAGTIEVIATNQGIAAQVVRLTFHGQKLY